MKKLVIMLAVAAAAHVGSAAFIPEVGNGTEPNKWTRNMSGVLTAAKTTGYPILLVMINEAANGDGCAHCKAFIANTVNTAEFAKLVSDYKFYMVMLNRWGKNEGEIFDPAHGSVSSAVFNEYFNRYSASQSFPVVDVIKSNGTRYKYWIDPQTRGTAMPGHIREAIAAISTSYSTFGLAAVSSTSVSEGGSWTGKITRSGNSGKTGTVKISLSGANAARYAVSPATITWDGADGEKTFTVTGPSTKDGVLSDTITVNITAEGFSGSTISYGAKSLSLSFKDASIGKTLAEFSASSGIATLSSGNIWYVPAKADGNVLETATSSSATLTWNVEANGELTVAGSASDSVKLRAALTPASGSAKTLDITADAQTIEVATGDKVVFTASVEGGDSQKVGFKAFSFSKSLVGPTYPDAKPKSVTVYLKGDAYLDYAASVSEGAAKVSYAITEGKLPSGLSLNKKTGMIMGTPTRAGTYSATVTASSDEGTQSIALSFTVAKLPADLKGEYSGIFFDARQSMVGSATWKVAKNGKWSGTIVREGRKTKLKGYVTVDENSTIILKDGGSISISLVKGSSYVWGGKWNGLQLYGTKAIANYPEWAGTWNIGVSSSANASMAGYATAKIAKKGTVKVAAKMFNKYKISSKNDLIKLGKSFVASNLSKWARNGDVAFVQIYKKSSGRVFNGGFAFYLNGETETTDAGAMFDYAGAFYDVSAGSCWMRPPLSQLDGSAAVTEGGVEEVTFPIKATDSKLSAGGNAYGAKIGGKASTGLFKGSYSAGGRSHKFEGVLFVKDGSLVGFGGGNAGMGNLFAIEIGDDK